MAKINDEIIKILKRNGFSDEDANKISSLLSSISNNLSIDSDTEESVKQGIIGHKELNEIIDGGIAKERQRQKVLKDNKELTEEEKVRKNKILEIIANTLEAEIDIDEELEKRLVLSKQSLELHDTQYKKIQKGLTLQEEVNKKILEFGVRHGINIDKVKNGISEIKEGGLKLVEVGKKFVEPWGEIDQAASNYAKAIGGSAESMNKLRKTTIDFVKTQEIGAKYNTSMVELLKLQENYNKQLGRSVSLTNEQKENMAAMRAVMGDELTNQFTASLANFGINPDTVAEMTGQMHSESSKKGISFEKYSRNMLNNIKLAQNYTFSKGIEGLERMAKKATEINLDMAQASRFADKVSTVEGALTAGASLSVLGGTFAQFGNPLAMMNDGLNDLEAMQDRMVKMFGDMAHWDSTKGQIDMSTFNRQRLKAASEATGTDYNANLDMIFSKSRRNIVQGQLGNRFDLDEDMRELILNTAQLKKDGKAFVTINGEEKSVDKLTNNDKSALRVEHNSDSDNIRDIATTLRGWNDSIEGLKKQKDAVLANATEVTGLGSAVKGAVQWLGSLGGLLMVPEFLSGVHSLLMIGNGFLAAIATRGGGGTIPGVNTGSGNGTGGTGGGFLTRKVGANSSQNLWNGKLYSKNGTQLKGTAFNSASKNLGVGGKFLNKVGGLRVAAPVAGGLIAGGIKGITELNNQSHTSGEKWGNTAAVAIGTGLGAAIGSFAGPLGTFIGGAVGGYLGEKVSGLWNNDKERESLHRQLGIVHGIDISDNYTPNELRQLINWNGNSRSSNSELRSKLQRNGDNIGILEGFKNGGIIDGVGTSTSDSNIVAVSKGEAILPAKTVSSLGVSKTQSLIDGRSVAPKKVGSNIGATKVKVEPIKVDISGTIKLDLGNHSTTIDANQLLQNQGFISELSKRLEQQITYGFNKEETRNKWSQTTY